MLPGRPEVHVLADDRVGLDLNAHGAETVDAPGGEDPAVVLKDAAVTLGGRTIWSAANVSIPQGAFVGLIGPNGTGKTTFLRVLLGQVMPSAGAVVVLGARPRRGNPAIGYVPQRRTLEADLAVRGRDLVLLGLVGHRWGFGRASQGERAAVVQALRAVGAEAYADEPVGILSGGQQQRLLIGQALLTQPRLLLLDEPLASLDLRSQHEIIHLVDSLRRERNIAVLFVAHDLNPLLEVLDGLIYILDGQPRAGALDDVMGSDVLSSLYATEVHVHRTPDGHRFVVGA
ncbi:MAG: ATP-binding cassette domain-containing protein [Chloroflexota bacterium]